MTAPRTAVTADATAPAIEIVREFDATPERVFRAHATQVPAGSMRRGPPLGGARRDWKQDRIVVP